MRTLIVMLCLTAFVGTNADAQSKKTKESQQRLEMKRDSVMNAKADSLSTVKDRDHSADWKSNQQYHNPDTFSTPNNK